MQQQQQPKRISTAVMLLSLEEVDEMMRPLTPLNDAAGPMLGKRGHSKGEQNNNKTKMDPPLLLLCKQYLINILFLFLLMLLHYSKQSI